MRRTAPSTSLRNKSPGGPRKLLGDQLVKLGYIDFPLIFEIIAFPDAYMDAVEPVRKLVADNWKGPGQGLPDLGSNIRFLKSCYDKSRQEQTKVPSCPKA